jgi:hypothetical protein
MSETPEFYSEKSNKIGEFIENNTPMTEVNEYIMNELKGTSIFRDFNRANNFRISGGKRKTRKLNKKTKRGKTRKIRKPRKTRKHRIYRGGFIYGATTKRPSLAATLKSSTSSSSRLSKNKNKNKNAIY